MKMLLSHVILLFIGVLFVEATDYTDWTVWLWLKASTNLDPGVIWSDSGSAYNDGDSRNVSYLVASGTTAYRSESVDDWNSRPPHLLRVTYRNLNGSPLYSVTFNATGKTSSNWFSESLITNSPRQGAKCSISHNFTSYATCFTCYNDSAHSRRYFASVVIKDDRSTDYVIANGNSPLYLPASDVSSGDCHYSYDVSNPLQDTLEMTDLTRVQCSSYCRELNVPFAAVHNVSCSCLLAQPGGNGLSACTDPCPGDATENCGGYAAGFPPGSIIFNYLNTDIHMDTIVSGSDTEYSENFVYSSPTEKSFFKAYYIYELRVLIDVQHTPVTVTIVMLYRAEPCSNTSLTSNETLTEIISVQDGSSVTYKIEPIHVQCAYISIYANDNPVTFDVDITLWTLKDGILLLATFLSIEAAWETVENTTEHCECECWIYNMLYGTSPFTNLTYAEKEEALKEVTQQLEKELSVNKSELSSTIRSRTSADDSRPSAVVVGYTLGVALLTLSLGMIFISDIPKILGSVHVFYENVQSRFGRPKPISPETTGTENS